MFRCLKCNKTFEYAATITSEAEQEESLFIEYRVCPHCISLSFQTETAEAVKEKVEGVYVADLKPGHNEEVDKLLREGWIITYRTSKQYILEKILENDKNAGKTEKT